MKSIFWRIVPFLFPLLFFLIATVKIRYPGINYDEIFWGNAALGALDETFIKRVAGLPLFIHDYIGALKPLLLSPVLRIFGVSVYTIRLPMLFVAAVSLLLLYRTVLYIFDRKTAILTLVLASCDASFIALARVDYGPVVLSYLFRLLSLRLFFLYVKQRKIVYLISLLTVLLLGYYNKFDFLWFIIAVLASSVILFWRDLYTGFWVRLPVKYRSLLLLSAGAQILIGILTLYRFVSIGFVDFFDFNHVKAILSGTFHLINGQSFYNYMIGRLYTFPGFLYSVFVLILVGGNTFVHCVYPGRTSRNYIFLFAVFLLIMVQISITKIAGASWHIIYIVPFIHIFLADALVTIYLKKSRFLALLILALFVSYQFFAYGRYIQGYGGRLKNPQWSKAIYELIDYTKKHDNKFVSVDWGTHDQLLVFNGVKNKYSDEWETLARDTLSKKDYKRITDTQLRNPGTIFILYAEGKAWQEKPRKTFFRIASEQKISLKRIHEIKDEGETIFELYRAVPDRTDNQ